MKTLYIECAMGAAGDMLMATLYDLMDDSQKVNFLEQMNALGIEGLRVEMEQTESHGISGSHAHVIIDGVEEGDVLAEMYDGLDGHAHHHGHEHDAHHNHEHHDHAHGHHHDAHDHHEHHHHHDHASPASVAARINAAAAPEAVRASALKVYQIIAAAEAKVHGETVDSIHYHEVGAVDAIADVVGCCLAMSILAPDAVVVSPIHVGSGTVTCAHGVVPVPAPATAEILKGVPIYGGEVQGELCTPTGAALLTHFATSFGPMPVMEVERTGYGIGVRDFGRPNCVRAFLGEDTGNGNGELCELVCNIDDMSPEALSYATARLLDRGALDAYLLTGTMKKGRSGHQLTVLCDPSNTDEVARAILEETTTNGLRVRTTQKYSLVPNIIDVETPWGTIRAKVAEGFGVRHIKPEHDDVSRIATEQSLPIRDVFEEVLRLAREQADL